MDTLTKDALQISIDDVLKEEDDILSFINVSITNTYVGSTVATPTPLTIPTTKSTTTKSKSKKEMDLKSKVLGLSHEEFEELIKFYNENVPVEILTPAQEIDRLLEKHKVNTYCPRCGSTIVHKDSKRNGVQRFKCTDCGKRFTRLSGTFAEKSQWTLAQYIQFINYMLTDRSLKTMLTAFKKEIPNLNETTLLYTRLKIMDAATKYPRPKLTGVVQMDEIHFHESQKGSLELVDPLKPNQTREAREGGRPSQYGSMGVEFATVCTAVDENNHLDVAKSVYGKLTLPTVVDICSRSFKDVSFLCTDKNTVYREYTKVNKIPHYVLPSKYRQIYKENKDKHTEEWLYRNESIDMIYNYGAVNYEQLQLLKKQHKLNLSRVNEIHKSLRSVIDRYHIGVTSKFLDYYVGFFVFKKNYLTDNPSAKEFTDEDCESILVELLSVRDIVTVRELKEMERNKEQASSQYMKKFIEMTEEVRDLSGNKYLKLEDEDGLNNFNKNDWINNQPAIKLRAMVKLLGIKGYTKMSTATMKAHLRTSDKFQEVLNMFLAQDIGDDISDEDLEWLDFLESKKKSNRKP